MTPHRILIIGKASTISAQIAALIARMEGRS